MSRKKKFTFETGGHCGWAYCLLVSALNI